jgi:hypothetical protein
MVIIPNFVVVADGLTFTVGQITWTTGLSDLTAMTIKEAQIQSVSVVSSLASAMALTMLATAPTMPTMCCLFPRYEGRQIDNIDMLEAIDQVGHKLVEK